jgi:hypothetical protein
MLRGEIWWARIPLSGSSGKSRPMLIVSHDVFNQNQDYAMRRQMRGDLHGMERCASRLAGRSAARDHG